MIKVYYKYDKLNKKHAYSISLGHDIFSMWIAYYLGKRLTKFFKKTKKTDLYLFRLEGSKLIYSGEFIEAKQAAKTAAKNIKYHYYKKCVGK